MPTQRPGNEPPSPLPGSARFFALLYTPAERRDAMSRLLAIADELGAGAAHPREPTVAQARLAWWRLEAERHAAGNAQHPWLRSMPSRTLAFDLPALIEAAAQDPGEPLRRAVFMAAAELLGARPSTPAQRAALAALAAHSWRCEPTPSIEPRPLPPDLRALHPLQRRLVPLVVWTALAARAVKSASWRRTFTDNVHAWNVARRALAGRYIDA